MKKPSTPFRFCIAALCLSIVTVAAKAQTSAPTSAAESPQSPGKFSLLFGVSAFVPGDVAFGGGVFGVAWMPGSKQMFSVEIGGGIGPSKKIAEYSYTLYRNGNAFKTLNDGKVSYDYSLMQLLLSWNRMFHLSEKCQLRVGPVLGLLSVSGKDSYSPTTYEGTAIDGMPEGTSHGKSAFTGGVVVGGRWRLSERFFLDLNYTLAGHTPIRFDDRTIDVLGSRVPVAARNMGYLNHRASLMFGWNLKSRKNR